MVRARGPPCLTTAARIARKAHAGDHPWRLAAELTCYGAAGSIIQRMALLLRHWWPVTLLLAPWSVRLRRAIIVAHALDIAIQYFRTGPRLDPFRFAVARRLDDLSYGAGVWYAAVRGGSLRSLMPDLRGRSRPR